MWTNPVLLLGAVLLVVHLVRLLRTSDSSAERWLLRRGFTPERRDVASVRTYLRRMALARLVGTLLFLGLSSLTLVTIQVPIGVAMAPYLLAVLVTEALSPDARHGRERQATLVPRPSDYFAPQRSVLLVRALLAVNLALGAMSYLGRAPLDGYVHLVVVLAGTLAFEGALRRISGRGLPEASGDRALDTAIRVASSRTVTAAGLLFAAVGWVYAYALGPTVLLAPASQSWQQQVFSIAVFWINGTCVGLAIHLSQPLTAWRARES